MFYRAGQVWETVFRMCVAWLGSMDLVLGEIDRCCCGGQCVSAVCNRVLQVRGPYTRSLLEGADL